MKDLYHLIKYVKLLAAAVYTADANSATMDLAAYRSCVLQAFIGVNGDTFSGSVKIELEVEHSDDDSVWSDCADADLLNTVVGTNPGTFAVIDANGETDALYQTGYIGSKRYVRVVANFTGTHTNGTIVGVSGLQGNAMKHPATL